MCEKPESRSRLSRTHDGWSETGAPTLAYILREVWVGGLSVTTFPSSWHEETL